MAFFKSNKGRSMGKSAAASNIPPGQVNMVGQGTVIEGTIVAKTDTRISGSVIGNVRVEGRVVITPEGEIEGEVKATLADVAGHIRGDLVITDRLVLKSQAVVEGNIRTAKLVIEDGAVFTGKCDMQGGAAVPKTGNLRPKDAGTSAA